MLELSRSPSKIFYVIKHVSSMVMELLKDSRRRQHTHVPLEDLLGLLLRDVDPQVTQRLHDFL